MIGSQAKGLVDVGCQRKGLFEDCELLINGSLVINLAEDPGVFRA
jgi:hypothetical protein